MLSPKCLSSVREDLLNNAVVCGLADKGDILVARRKGGGVGKSVREKHAEDIWVLANTLRNLQHVLRVLLRNGKKSKSAWTRGQELVKSTEAALQDVSSLTDCDIRVSNRLDACEGNNASGSNN